ncbi:putative Fe-Mo cluster-binding NifX family protein [Breznakia sp. PF5-3]|uniref:NifB/NifX family molybdenum-iron cluster-binding protein n=1 Tax=unclassified Breznakia TaxID=2623764 RepID=UPI0024064DA7|nr:MULTISPECIES: NifB/NifX family molybdenum-iron cluster-binding protein [unclassified Breznakia]MDF9824162.1 putative Fe-Mo cluster-binding NifX family protein [Breznakia sp. PM6-1]MDF9834960.1 putative Fe-Mo cluster-binding NifX family protein [Breznakia sp. PF5-3]MDF9837171.1 putative Fe-Mo cluster-binding NifX family protein [Breznakia sp. PFB2-8]MDF9859161.1 putative Fe-Mo cluster-binding NifX family protein [Breznakia sp. PH5-24]
MKLAVTYDEGNVFQHFGKTTQFKIFEIRDNKIVDSECIGTNGQGHGSLGKFLKDQGIDALICGGIGAGAREILKENNIAIYGSVQGKVDEVVQKFLSHSLIYSTDASCNHHGDDHKCHH